MNRNIAIVIAVLSVVAVVLASIGMYNAAKPTGMTVIAYDAEGNKVFETATSAELIGFGWNNKDGPIYSVVVTVTYSVSGQDDGSAVSVSAVEKVYCCSLYASDRSSALKVTNGAGWSDSLASNTHTTSYLIADLMSRSTKGDEYGYILYFDVTLTASGVSEGSSVSKTLPLSAHISNLYWTDPTFSLVGTIGFA